MNKRNPLKDAANHLASKGRYGDTMLVHMNPIEVDMLASLSPTGELTTNPDTGQKEAFLPLLFSMAAPSLMAGAVSPLVASALGTSLGTIAEGGSLGEGIKAGLMGGITGGLVDKFVGGSEMFKDIAKPATESVGTTAADITQATGGIPTPFGGGVSDALSVVPNVAPPVSDPNIFQRMGNVASNALSPENIGQTAGSAASGLVGEMYVPFDTPEALEEESEFQYEGPYMPTEQRRMIPMGDPLASAFEGEQMMLEGDVLPQGYNMRPDGFNIGGLIQRFEEGGMPDDPQKQIEAMADEQRKRFKDFQPEGMLKGTFFDYVPDKTQTMLFMMDRMGMPVPGQGIPADDPERVMNPLDPRRTMPAPEPMLDPRRLMPEPEVMLDPRRTMSPEDIIDDRGPDFRFTEEELFRMGDRPVPTVPQRMGDRPAPSRRKLMEPVR